MLHVYASLVTWKELTAFSTSAHAAPWFCTRRKEAAARWEACEGTHLLASTGRCLVNRRQKEGQSKKRKQPAVSHFLIQIRLARNTIQSKPVFCTFRASGNQYWKANRSTKRPLFKTEMQQNQVRDATWCAKLPVSIRHPQKPSDYKNSEKMEILLRAVT